MDTIPAMRRWLFTTCWTLSLVGCLATCIAWALSYRDPRSATIERFRAYSVICSHGEMSVDIETRFTLFDERHDSAGRALEEYPPYSAQWEFAGTGPLPAPAAIDQKRDHFFGKMRMTALTNYMVEAIDFGVDVTYLAAPCSLVAAFFAILPVCAVIAAHRRLHRVRIGHCHFCGYDLCATPGRCPECGVIPATPCSIE